MRTCKPCGISDWHPEARTCTVPSCELRQPITSSPAAANDTSGRSLAGGVPPCLAGNFVDQRTGDGEANGLVGQVQGVAVHTQRNHTIGARHHG
jgi:hypothetical protein